MDVTNLVQLKTRLACLITEKKRFEQELENYCTTEQAGSLEKQIVFLDEEIKKLKPQIME